MANIGLRTTGPRLTPGYKPLISKIYYSSLFALNSKHAKLHDWVDYGTVSTQEKKKKQLRLPEYFPNHSTVLVHSPELFGADPLLGLLQQPLLEGQAYFGHPSRC